jgi:DNA repair ATPase RecN
MDSSLCAPSPLSKTWNEALDTILEAFASAIRTATEREQAVAILPAARPAAEADTSLAAINERLQGLDRLTQRCETTVGEAEDALKIAGEQYSFWLNAVAANRQRLACLGVLGIR